MGRGARPGREAARVGWRRGRLLTPEAVRSSVSLPSLRAIAPPSLTYNLPPPAPPSRALAVLLRSFLRFALDALLGVIVREVLPGKCPRLCFRCAGALVSGAGFSLSRDVAAVARVCYLSPSLLSFSVRCMGLCCFLAREFG